MLAATTGSDPEEEEIVTVGLEEATPEPSDDPQPSALCFRADTFQRGRFQSPELGNHLRGDLRCTLDPVGCEARFR